MVETAAFKTETYQPVDNTPGLYEVGEKLPENCAVIVNELPEFRFVTKRARQVAESICDERMALLREGEFDSVPMPIDMTGTARRAVEAERQHGNDSPEAMIQYQAVEDDAERQMAESISKMTWGYFPELTHLHSEEQQGFTAYGRLLREVTASGISPMLEAEDTERAKNDYVLQSIDDAFIHSGYTEDHVLFTIAECADWAIEKYHRDQANGNTTATYGGLVPENEKMMIQCVSFDQEEGERSLEQIGIPGTHIKRSGVHRALQALGIIKPGEEIAKTELQGLRIMVHKDVMSNVLDMAKLLDQMGSEENGEELIMGIPRTREPHLTYETVPLIAEQRQQEYAGLTEKLVDKMLELERTDVDKWQTETHISNFLKQEFREIVKRKPEEARKVFNETTAEKYVAYNELQRSGRYEEAFNLEQEAFASAPAPSSCGAGSCGLKEVSATNSEDLAAAKRMGVKPGEMKDKMVSFNKGFCKGCRTVTKMYYKTDNSDAACSSCETTKKDVQPKEKAKPQLSILSLMAA